MKTAIIKVLSEITNNDISYIESSFELNFYGKELNYSSNEVYYIFVRFVNRMKLDTRKIDIKKLKLFSYSDFYNLYKENTLM